MEDAPTRRAVLLAAAATVGVVGGVAAGAAYAGLRPEPSGGRPAPPPELVAAARAEADLIALIAAETSAHGSLASFSGITADHTAHLSALNAALAAYPGAPAARSTSPPPQASASDDVARSRLRVAEQRAAAAAAARARVLSGPPAAVLASISACEATHAALLG